MPIKKTDDIASSEITDETTYLNRRNFMRAGLLAGTTLATAGLYKLFNQPPPAAIETAQIETSKTAENAIPIEDKPNSLKEITNYNNYYEFSTDKSSVAESAKDFVTRPWTVEIGGLVQKPKTFDIEDLLKFQQEERIYRFRCVEGWSMVIPWVGFSLKMLLDQVEPLGTANYVAFETHYDQKQMPNGRYAGIDLPYLEGLRLDEAQHHLTILATGLYGKQMPNQNGAPIRLIVPWKYGFKSIKSIVKITLTESVPSTTWNIAAPGEYGFYSNVNPEVGHPRWSQATERRIGELSSRKTLMFNGYAEEVGRLYQGMDLKKYF